MSSNAVVSNHRIRYLETETAEQVKSLAKIPSLCEIVVELVMNSLDSDATRVDIQISISPKAIDCTVTDNGFGISPEDLDKVGKRFASSKSRGCATTFGGDGQALANILQCCNHISIISRHKDYLGTFHRSISTGDRCSVGAQLVSAAHKKPKSGTTITVHKVFSKLPVRLAQITSGRDEMSRIRKQLGLLALLRPTVKFCLFDGSRNKLVASFDSAQNYIERFKTLHQDVTIADSEYYQIDMIYRQYRLTGFVAQKGWPNSQHQYLFINNRRVDNSVVFSCIKPMFQQSRIFLDDEQAECIFMLHLIVAEPNLVDLKMGTLVSHVEFKEGSAVKAVIRRAIKDALKHFGFSICASQKAETPKSVKPFEKTSTKLPANAKMAPVKSAKFQHLVNPVLAKPRPAVMQLAQHSDFISFDLLKTVDRRDLQPDRLEVLSQVYNQFIVCRVTQPSGHIVVILIDQHAADERIRVDRFFQQLESVKSGLEDSVALQHSQNLHLSAQQLEFANLYRTRFADWGIQFDLSGNRVTHVPSLIVARCEEEPQRTRNLVCDYMRTLESESASQYWSVPQKPRSIARCPKVLIGMIHSIACRGAIKFGDPLSIDQCRQLILQLSSSDFPFQCAHGRPSMIPILQL